MQDTLEPSNDKLKTIHDKLETTRGTGEGEQENPGKRGEAGLPGAPGSGPPQATHLQGAPYLRAGHLFQYRVLSKRVYRNGLAI